MPVGSMFGWHWIIKPGLIWLFILGCAVAAWVLGYGIGYRRGIRDAMTDRLPKADQCTTRE
jgi:hypothetical protein